MKKQLYIFLFLFSFASQAQTNLVPNPSFEIYDTCPTTEDQTEFCTGWSKYSASSTTPDYYNACSSSSTFGVPQNSSFYQQDHRNCGAYMALMTRVDPLLDYREHIGIQLSQSLTIGQKYFLSFYTVMALSDDFTTPSNNIGLRLSTVAYNPSNPSPIDNFSHLRSISIISDTANWMRISGSIIADSAYNYLVIGNFYDDANTDTLTQTCGTCQNVFSYYLIDDVCISTDSLLANGGVNILPCTTGVDEKYENGFIVFYPNPVNDSFIIDVADNVDYVYKLFDIAGRELLATKSRGKTKVDVSYLPKGIYILNIKTENGSFNYKIVVQH